MVRPLNVNEYLSWVISKGSPHNILITAKIEGYIDPERLHHSINKLIDYNPMLKLSIDKNNAKFVFVRKIDIPISVHDDKKANWTSYAEIELSKKFDPYSILARLTLVKKENNINYLLFCFHHIIGDGASGLNFISDLLKIYSSSSLNRKHQSMIPDPIKLYPQIGEFKEDIQNRNSNTTRCKSICLSKNEISTLLNKLKHYNTTFNGFLACVALRAASEVEVQKSDFILHIPVNIRNKLMDNADDKKLSFITSWIEIPIDIKKFKTTRDLAFYIADKIKSKLINNEPLDHLVSINTAFSTSSWNDILKSVQASVPTIAVSNPGKLSFDSIYGDIKLLELHHSGNCQAFLSHANSFYLAVTNLNNESMSIDMNYSEPAANEEKMLKILYDVKKNLTS